MTGTIAICITTRNRQEAFCKSIHQQLTNLPTNATLIVVNDAGEPTEYDTFRFPERAGIPRAKNKCLELAMAAGSDEIFLFDDDCYPISKGWEMPYIRSPFRHLCFTFLPQAGIYPDGLHKYHSLGNGCMLYIHRDVVDNIGGFDTSFGIGKYEHTQFSFRAYNAGYCPFLYMDVIGSEHLLYSMDEHGEVERSMTEAEMETQLRNGYERFHRTIGTTLYCDYN